MEWEAPPPVASDRVTVDLQAKFERVDVAYKTVNQTPIETAIFIPKDLAAGPEAQTAPVLVNFHGGALVTGANPEPFFMADWVRNLAHTTKSIFLCPAYRLIPESRAVEILDDVGDFWTWLHAHLPAEIAARYPHLTPDLTRVVASGESAGGYLALQSALQFNGTAKLRAVMTQYPALFPDVPGFRARPAGVPEQSPLDVVVDDAIKSARAARGTVVIRTSSPWPAKADLIRAVFATGRLADLYGEDPEGRLTLRYALARAEEAPPPLWLIQGDEDAMVQKDWTDEVVAGLRRERPKAVVKYTVRPGSHGFDQGNQLEDDWVKEGVEFIKGYWLQV
ncbi:Alpha/Beta hydrolase protein [Chaetomium strumarium]|uniref:Alpha/Beta hydrolase protein n=1 Tax=Chaetomium strumarium TaxID=1170767 RepID=A0AAJ0M2K3_9PEZI|nr:Alpha/Beta hydrolase protein [Chaetomium strumarium]